MAEWFDKTTRETQNKCSHVWFLAAEVAEHYVGVPPGQPPAVDDDDERLDDRTRHWSQYVCADCRQSEWRMTGDILMPD